MGWKLVVYLIADVILLPVFLLWALVTRFLSKDAKKPSVVFGFDPLINIKYWCEATCRAGYSAKTLVFNVFKINKDKDFDIVFRPAFCPSFLRRYAALFSILWNFNILIISFNALFSNHPLLKHFEPLIYKIAKKKIVVWPYGSDAFSYRFIRDISAQNALQISYPQAAKRGGAIERQVRRWIKYADVVMSGHMAPDGIGRWDVVIANFLAINTDEWKPSEKPYKQEKTSKVVIAHTPNHRGAKGTEFLIKAVKNLQLEGHPIVLRIIENLSNDEVKVLLEREVDILVEQLILPGHGLSAIEGMSCGLPVISNLSNDEYAILFRRYSFFNECPILSGTPENIERLLRHLILNPELRRVLGKAGRAYAEKYHSYEFSGYLFDKIIRNIFYQESIDLINLFHPLLGEYSKRKPYVEHPLIKNILD